MKKITNVRSNIYDVLENEILEADCSENEKENRLADLLRLRRQETNILLVGATGCGKSSTINALFDMNMAKVGVGVEPETKEIVKYELDNLIVWDTPGLGDDVRKDEDYKNEIILSFWENVKNSIEDYRWEGEYKGEMYFGEIGKTFGRVLGSATGALVGIFKGLFK